MKKMLIGELAHCCAREFRTRPRQSRDPGQLRLRAGRRRAGIGLWNQLGWLWLGYPYRTTERSHSDRWWPRLEPSLSSIAEAAREIGATAVLGQLRCDGAQDDCCL